MLQPLHGRGPKLRRGEEAVIQKGRCQGEGTQRREPVAMAHAALTTRLLPSSGQGPSEPPGDLGMGLV